MDFDTKENSFDIYSYPNYNFCKLFVNYGDNIMDLLASLGKENTENLWSKLNYLKEK